MKIYSRKNFNKVFHKHYNFQYTDVYDSFSFETKKYMILSSESIGSDRLTNTYCQTG